MTGRLPLDLAVLVAAQLTVLLIPWLAPHVVYMGHVDPSRYPEQGMTVVRARLFLVLPLTVVVCWFAVRWLDLRHDVVIVVYSAVIVRLVRFAARTGAGRAWLRLGVLLPLISFSAVYAVARSLATGHVSVVEWILGGLAALLLPVAVMATTGRALGTAVDAAA